VVSNTPADEVLLSAIPKTLRNEEESAMLWWGVRKAAIDGELRKTFERYGTLTMQVILGTTNIVRHNGINTPVQAIEESLLEWLTEQYDRTDLKDTWFITMEVAITFLVSVEVVLSFLTYFCKP
jgi:hypothetical protein